jgi:hypothetical protein
MYRQFNIQQFYVLPTQLYLCFLCGSENKQRLFPYTALTDCFLITQTQSVHCAVRTECLNAPLPNANTQCANTSQLLQQVKTQEPQMATRKPLFCSDFLLSYFLVIYFPIVMARVPLGSAHCWHLWRSPLPSPFLIVYPNSQVLHNKISTPDKTQSSLHNINYFLGHH